MFTDNQYPHSEQVSKVVGEGAGHCYAIPVLYGGSTLTATESDFHNLHSALASAIL